MNRNIVQFPPFSLPETDVIFKCDDASLYIINRYMYTYLGIVLNEHLDYNIIYIMYLQNVLRNVLVVH